MLNESMKQGGQIGEWISDTSNWFASHNADILIGAAIAAVMFFGLVGLRSLARRMAKASDDKNSLKAIISGALGRTWHLTLVLIAAVVLARLAQLPERPSGWLWMIFVAVITLQAASWARRIILGLMERRAAADTAEGSEALANAVPLLRVLISAVLVAIAAVTVLSNLGINVTGLLAGLGIGGIAIGLAARGVFEDLFAALAIIFDKPFRKGETVQYDTTTAKVERIGLKSTRLRATTGEALSIGNTQLLSKQIANLTRLSRRRVSYELPIHPATPPEDLRRIPALLESAISNGKIDDIDVVFKRAGLASFALDAINFTIDIDVMSDDAMAVAHAKSAIGLGIMDQLGDAGIRLAKA